MSLANLVPVIRNSQCYVRTSSQFNNEHSVNNIALNYNNAQGNPTAWCASYNDTNQYVTVGSEVPRTFVAVSIQGRHDYTTAQWVTSFRIRYTLDNVNWTDYRNQAAIAGSTDRDTVVTHFFDTPIRARTIELIPLSWNNHISMRCEFYAQPVVHTYTQTGSATTGPNSSLFTGNGNRDIVVPVVFNTKFASTPKVTLTFDLIDATNANENTARAKVVPTNITSVGFDAVFSTWSDSKVYQLSADYVAVLEE